MYSEFLTFLQNRFSGIVTKSVGGCHSLSALARGRQVSVVAYTIYAVYPTGVLRLRI
jgi:hypothetical protein